MKKVTLKTIAEIAEVGISTVSMSLNDHPNINPETKRKIKQIAKELNYVPNIIARAMVRKQTSLIGVIIPQIEGSFYPAILEGLEDILTEKYYSTLLCVTNHSQDREHFYLNLLCDKHVDGIIIEPSREFIGEIEKFIPYLEKIPTIFALQQYKPDSFTNVIVNNEKGGYLAGEHLAAICQKRILFVGGPKGWFTNQRLKGFQMSLEKKGYPLAEEDCYFTSRYTYEAGRKVAAELLKEKKDIDGIFVASDIIAMGVMHELRQNNMQVPEDINLIGFDDLPFVSMLEVPLTTVAQPQFELGNVMGQKLIQQIENYQQNPELIVLEPTLIVRQSTKKKV